MQQRSNRSRDNITSRSSDNGRPVFFRPYNPASLPDMECRQMPQVRYLHRRPKFKHPGNTAVKTSGGIRPHLALLLCNTIWACDYPFYQPRARQIRHASCDGHRLTRRGGNGCRHWMYTVSFRLIKRRGELKSSPRHHINHIEPISCSLHIRISK